MSVESEIQRILALPQREPVDCERQRGAGRMWAPEAQALIDVVTARYTRKRLTCGCRPRLLISDGDGTLRVYRTGSPGSPPPPVLRLTVEAFLIDCVGTTLFPEMLEREAFSRVRSIERRGGERLELPGLGHQFCLTELNPVQAWTLREIPRVEGILGLISVGAGKTLTGILAVLAMALDPAATPPTVVIFAKPKQRFHYQDNYLRAREHFRVPTIVFDRTSGLEGSFYVDKTPALHFIPYSLLSSPKSTELLESLQPVAIIADEMHLLADPTSTRTMRWERYMGKRNNEGSPVRFLGWTGTPIGDSIKDISHLAKWSLGTQSPYPLKPSDVDAFSVVMDPSPRFATDWNAPEAVALRRAFGGGRAVVKGLAALVADAGAVQRGHREIMLRVPGVISTRSSSIKSSITISEWKVPPIPAEVEEALGQVRKFERPDGEELEEAAEQARVAGEVISGFYYYWVFTHNEPEALIKEWLLRRKAFKKELRVKLLNGEVHLDSTKLCEDAARRAWRTGPCPVCAGARVDPPCVECSLPVWPAESWPAWAEIADMVKPESRPRWISDEPGRPPLPADIHPGYYLARAAARWGLEHRGVIWYHSDAFGAKIAELSGLPLHAGGPGAERAIKAEDGSRSIIVSINAFGESLDGLQYNFFRQLITQVPPSGKKWEQCLDAHTEILTNSGWLGIDAPEWSLATTGTAAYSINDGSIRWSPAKRIERTLGNEKMFGINNPHLDIRVTAGHRMIHQKPSHKSDRVSNPYHDSVFVEAASVPRIGRIPIAGEQKSRGVQLTDDELTIIGMFLTDGHFDKSNGTLQIFQSERYPEVIKECLAAFARGKFKVGHKLYTKPTNLGERKYPLHCWWIPMVKKPRADGLRGWWEIRKFLVKGIAKALEPITAKQLRVLLHGMWLGDGSKTAGTYSYDPYTPQTLTIATSRAQVVDTIQSLCVRRGLRCNASRSNQSERMWKMHISDQLYWSLVRKASDSRPVWGEVNSDPSERVWCASVDTGAIVIRRNGKVAVVGNCLGRLARLGQPADEIITEVPRHTPENRQAFRKAYDLAEFIEATTPNRQLLLAADVEWM